MTPRDAAVEVIPAAAQHSSTCMVRLLSGRTLRFELELASTTVRELREQVAESMHISSYRIDLALGGHLLPVDALVSDYVRSEPVDNCGNTHALTAIARVTARFIDEFLDEPDMPPPSVIGEDDGYEWLLCDSGNDVDITCYLAARFCSCSSKPSFIRQRMRRTCLVQRAARVALAPMLEELRQTIRIAPMLLTLSGKWRNPTGHYKLELDPDGTCKIDEWNMTSLQRCVWAGVWASASSHEGQTMVSIQAVPVLQTDSNGEAALVVAKCRSTHGSLKMLEPTEGPVVPGGAIASSLVPVVRLEPIGPYGLVHCTAQHLVGALERG